MKQMIVLVVYCAFTVTETRGAWYQEHLEEIYRAIHKIQDTKSMFSRTFTESMQKGLIDQWVTPHNFTYDYIHRNVNFYVYTRQNWLHGQQVWLERPQSIAGSNYQPWKNTAILIHGFGVDSTSDSVQLIKKKLLEVYDMNVIGVDYGKLMDHWWYELCSPCGMAVVVLQAPKVGRCVAEFISSLVDSGQSLESVHIIGHSLGAHIAGFTGKSLYMFQNTTVARITGLDPSSPGFTEVKDTYRLAQDDADYTDCIYTTAESISVRKPICQVNFYPNGCGKSQPGCFVGDFQTYGGCSHSRVVDLFAESIEPGSNFETQKCNGVPCIGSGTVCWPSNETNMGYNVNKSVSGIFYTETNSAYPFSRNVTDTTTGSS